MVMCTVPSSPSFLQYNFMDHGWGRGRIFYGGPGPTAPPPPAGAGAGQSYDLSKGDIFVILHDMNRVVIFGRILTAHAQKQVGLFHGITKSYTYQFMAKFTPPLNLKLAVLLILQ